MTNIPIPEDSKTVTAIYAAYKKEGDTEPVRGYLGASIIGHPCERYLWYCFRQCCKPEFDGRMYRLFKTGDFEEFRLTMDLRNIGCEVHECDENGEQFAVSALGGHFSGHLDGCAFNIPEAPKAWHVSEFKTHNVKSFRDLVKKGVKVSKPQHYAQMMVYMHLTGMKRALYLARNKDTDELYSERIRYNKAEADALMDRARRIITTTTPPDRISGQKDYYQCRWCDAKEICWGSEESSLPVPSLSCRQCCHATPITDRKSMDSAWKCEKRDVTFWPRGTSPCEHHLTLPGLLPFVEPIDSNGNYIVFQNEDGTIWRHGNADGCFSSQELMKLPTSALKSTLLRKAKDVFGAVAIGAEKSILARYPEEDSKIAWKGEVELLVAVWGKIYNEDLTKMKPVVRDYNWPDYDAAEMCGGRLAITWGDGTAEIREGVE